MVITIGEVKEVFPYNIIKEDNIGNICILFNTGNENYEEIISNDLMNRGMSPILDFIKQNMDKQIMISKFKKYCEEHKRGNIIVSPDIGVEEIVMHPEKYNEFQRREHDRL